MKRFRIPKIFADNKRLKLIAGSILHAVVLVIATLWLLQQNYTYGDERFVIRWSSIIKKIVFKIDDKPPRNDLLFINTSYDNMLIDRLDDDGFQIGNQVITDREKLAREMRKGLGCGSFVEEGNVILQGDICDRAREWLLKNGVKEVVCGN